MIGEIKIIVWVEEKIRDIVDPDNEKSNVELSELIQQSLEDCCLDEGEQAKINVLIELAELINSL